jgi:hypothetical protein
LIAVRGSVVSDVWTGQPRLSDLIQPFEGTENVVMYQQGERSYLGYTNFPGGKLFSLTMTDDQFKLSDLSTSLPIQPDVKSVFSVRMDSFLASVMGGPKMLNSILFIYPDSEATVKKVYVLDRGYVFRDHSSRCQALENSGFLPQGMSCKSQ